MISSIWKGSSASPFPFPQSIIHKPLAISHKPLAISGIQSYWMPTSFMSSIGKPRRPKSESFPKLKSRFDKSLKPGSAMIAPRSKPRFCHSSKSHFHSPETAIDGNLPSVLKKMLFSARNVGRCRCFSFPERMNGLPFVTNTLL